MHLLVPRELMIMMMMMMMMMIMMMMMKANISKGRKEPIETSVQHLSLVFAAEL